MTLEEMQTQLKDIAERFPGALKRDVKILTGAPGSSEVRDVAISATENVWILGE